jgi:hypothetical protein
MVFRTAGLRARLIQHLTLRSGPQDCVSKGWEPVVMLPITARGLPRAIETPRFARLLRMRLVLIQALERAWRPAVQRKSYPLTAPAVRPEDMYLRKA